MTERTISSSFEEQPHEELDVFGRYSDGSEEQIGTVELTRIHKDYRDLPTEIEIDGVVYYPQF